MRDHACLALALRLGRAVLLAGSLLGLSTVGLAADDGRGERVTALAFAPKLSEKGPELSDDGSPGTDDGFSFRTGDAYPSSSQAGDRSDDDSSSRESDCKMFSIHGQTTVVTDFHAPFHSAYVGPHSFLPIYENATSQTSTLFLGARLWQGGELYFNPEVAGGKGLSSVAGIAGFPNGEITRVGKPQPTPYVARLFYSQVFGFGGEQEKMSDEANQIAGYRDISRLTVRVGKFAASDDLDDNSYSHDGRSQFWNWGLVWNGAWDFPADVRGYTYGGTVDFNQEKWALRYGLFAEPLVANGPDLDPNFSHAHGQVLELENRFNTLGRPSIVRSMAYLNNANMGNYKEATDNPAFGLDITKTRRYSAKYGFGLSLQQDLSDDLGLFMRGGWSDGHNETWAFTEIDRTFSVGLVLKGSAWSRQQDRVGTAFVINGLSPDHRNYLAAGGLGFILGDGQLNYGLENILESYYRWELKKNIYVTADLQYVSNPGYNRDRGPVFVPGLGVHAEF